jgi:hypothetical protein
MPKGKHNDRYVKEREAVTEVLLKRAGDVPMSRALALGIVITDVVFSLYWALSAAYLSGLVDVPDAYLFSGYHDRHLVAWNWSFFPLDLAATAFGAWAILASRRQGEWRTLAAVSLALWSTAGGMAVAYWTLMGEFDPSWFLPNLVVFVWPLFFLPGLIRPSAST